MSGMMARSGMVMTFGFPPGCLSMRPWVRWGRSPSLSARPRRYSDRMPSNVLDLEQGILLLELEPPFGKREVQLARRRLAKVWHPDLAPPGKQFEHERHLQAINSAADQLERLAEGSRGGGGSRHARQGRAPGGRQAGGRGGPRG